MTIQGTTNSQSSGIKKPPEYERKNSPGLGQSDALEKTAASWMFNFPFLTKLFQPKESIPDDIAELNKKLKTSFELLQNQKDRIKQGLAFFSAFQKSNMDWAKKSEDKIKSMQDVAKNNKELRAGLNVALENIKEPIARSKELIEENLIVREKTKKTISEFNTELNQLNKTVSRSFLNDMISAFTSFKSRYFAKNKISL